jgi:hypothetical protein
MQLITDIERSELTELNHPTVDRVIAVLDQICEDPSFNIYQSLVAFSNKVAEELTELSKQDRVLRSEDDKFYERGISLIKSFTDLKKALDTGSKIVEQYAPEYDENKGTVNILESSSDTWKKSRK